MITQEEIDGRERQRVKDLFARTLLRIINLQFETQQGKNPEHISLTNSSGNSIYVTMYENSVTVNALKNSRSCLRKMIKDIHELEPFIEILKTKVKCVDNEKA